MTGAESLLRTLSSGSVDVCFMNPGTTEMHLVHAVDAVTEVRGVLCLFEGVCTGAADGFGRMTGRPATTLVHLGAGLGNGIANLHNARRARTPIINLDNPPIGWVELAASMGVPGCRAQTAEEFDSALSRSFAEPGPFLIEADVPTPKREDLARLIPKRT